MSDDFSKTGIDKTSSLELGEPTNSATFDLPDVGAAQRYQRDEARKSRDLNHSDGQYDVKTNSCMTHVTDVLNAGGANVPATGRQAWAFLNKAGVGPRPIRVVVALPQAENVGWYDEVLPRSLFGPDIDLSSGRCGWRPDATPSACVASVVHEQLASAGGH
ncbi:MAG: hypothetical protein V4764_21915 [Burkholderia sp.]